MPTVSQPRSLLNRQHQTTKGLVPAAARVTPDGTVHALTAEELDANLSAIETFATAVGGRQSLLDTLAVADTAPECEKVVNLLLDPRYASWSLKRLCGIAGITVADLFAAYKKAMIVKAHIEATAIIARKLPPVVADVMTRAAPVDLPCEDCDGKGTLQKRVGHALIDSPCRTCSGTGTVRSTPDLDRQKLALELGQLTQQRGGLSIVQQNLNAASAASAALSSGPLEQLQQAVGDLLFSPGRRRTAGPSGADAPAPPIDVQPSADAAD